MRTALQLNEAFLFVHTAQFPNDFKIQSTTQACKFLIQTDNVINKNKSPWKRARSIKQRTGLISCGDFDRLSTIRLDLIFRSDKSEMGPINPWNWLNFKFITLELQMHSILSYKLGPIQPNSHKRSGPVLFADDEDDNVTSCNARLPYIYNYLYWCAQRPLIQ